MIRGLPKAEAERIEEARRRKVKGERRKDLDAVVEPLSYLPPSAFRLPPFASVDDFTRRTGLSPKAVAKLARADAFQSLEVNRRLSLWQSLGQEPRGAAARPLLADLNDDEPLVALPAMTGQQEVHADYQTAGLSLKAHPIGFLRESLDELGVVPAAQLAEIADGRFVRVAGLVLVRQRPGTAKGITFVTLEDETGVANLIIRMDVWERFYHVARTAPAYIAHGRLQNQQGVIHVLVTKLENLSQSLANLGARSRDFQ
jgi:error-prone DNA polymerase